MKRLVVLIAVVATAACASANQRPAEASFDQAGRIEVLVRDEQGEPVDADAVRFVPDDPDVVVLDMGTQTDEPGRFVHDQLLPGDYTVEVEAAGFEPASVRVPLAAKGDESAEVVLTRP